MNKDDEFVWSPPEYTWEDWWDDNNQSENENDNRNEFVTNNEDVDNSWVEKFRGIFKI